MTDTIKSTGHLRAQRPWPCLKTPTGQRAPMANHHLNIFNTINSEKDEELTFVAIGNRSQAKEEEGEKIHSVHLREEKER